MDSPVKEDRYVHLGVCIIQKRFLDGGLYERKKLVAIARALADDIEGKGGCATVARCLRRAAAQFELYGFPATAEIRNAALDELYGCREDEPHGPFTRFCDKIVAASYGFSDDEIAEIMARALGNILKSGWSN